MNGRAVIVGAGISGLSTAIGLAEAGWRVTVWERWPQVVGAGAGLGLWPQARAGLAALGLGPAVQGDSVPVAAAALYRADGRALLRMPENSRRVPHVRMISRRRLMELLLERAEAGGAEIRTGVAADGAPLRAALAGADVLIGADGLRSTVRTEFFGTATRPRYSGLIGIRGDVGFESGAYGETWGDGAVFGNTPLAPGRTYFYAAFPGEPDDQVTLAGLRRRFQGWREPIPAILAAATGLLRHPVYDLHPKLPRFTAGRVALLGDAAHAMTPHAGRGACEAVLDAVALTRHLTGAGDVETALGRYDRERRRPAQRIASQSWHAGRVTQSDGVPAVLRDAALRLLNPLVRVVT